MPQTFDHVAFETADMDSAIRFYVEKLGFTLLSRTVSKAEQEEYAFLSLGVLRLELIQHLGAHELRKPEPRAPWCPHLAIATDSMDATVKGLRDCGVNVLRGPLRIEGEATWLYIADPDNNVLEFIEWLRAN